MNLEKKLFTELSQIIEQGKSELRRQVNSTITMVYWQVGRRINEDILNSRRAEYGKQIVPAISAYLESEYGRQFTEKNLRRMMQFAEIYPDLSIVAPLAR